MGPAKRLVERVPRLVRRGCLALLVLLLVAYGYAVSLTYREDFAAVPDEMWESRNPEAIRQAASVSMSWNEPAVPGSSGIGEENTSASFGLISVADRWVDAINRLGEGTILYHHVDSMGNLYLAVSPAWAELTLEHQENALDHLGTGWRAYLRDSFGAWDGAEGFSPGIVLVDTEGRFAQNINGEIAIYRGPVY